MTTQNLDQEGINNLRAAMSYTADDARRRAEATLAEAAQITAERDQDAQDAAITARLLAQHHADRLRPVNEEAGQLAFIIGGPQAQPAPTDGTPPGDPADGATVVHEPTAVVPAVPRQETHVFRVTRIHHSGTQLVFALVGVIIGLLVALFTYQPAFDDVHGSGHDALVTLWFIVLCGLGFCLGGWFGWFVEEHSADDEPDEEAPNA